MNQPQKNNSQTTDIRQKHINAIRQRLKQKREEYCKTRSDKNILGPGAIHNYLKENYNISDDAELIQALSKMKPMEIGFMTNRRNEDDK